MRALRAFLPRQAGHHQHLRLHARAEHPGWWGNEDHGVIDLCGYPGAKCDLRSTTDFSCTNGNATCTSATAAFTSADVGKLLAIVGPPPDRQTGTAYTYNQMILPSTGKP